ncbi:hypothetical protein [Dyadobacter arcticus]|uniref:Uncharacterized protein n=1 Tax=Dyadobacter arcticus TaxID=1078754 RepID=A0ABX0UID9_9BACT|nr:hypothetical protein [Dyadobacter arcticus]NIJ51445.1 hypothetical protein [Dyadobacter arcticus]
MQTEPNPQESADPKLIAYGKEVSSLLSSSNPKSWTAELWTMFGGYVLALKELGYTPGLSNTFWSWKELVDFFEKVEEIRKGEGG